MRMAPIGGPGGFGFGRGGFPFEYGGGGRGGGQSGRRPRILDGEGLQLLLLKLIGDEPRHGYQLIRAIEELTGGSYAPSPGVVYPTLTLLDDMGLIAERQSNGAKKVYEITGEGRAHLAARAGELADAEARLDAIARRQRRHQRPEMTRAMGNLMTALRNRAVHEDWNDDQLNRVVDILDEAARKIERIG